MNERTHLGLHQYLAMYLDPANRTTWDTMLNVASWVHNSSVHDSLKVSPFEIVTGLKPRSAQSWLPGPDQNAAEIANQFQDYYGVSKEHLENIRERARQMIGKAQDDYLIRLNKYSKEMPYKVGDLVLTRIQDRSTYISRKWHAKYKGPYKVTAIVGPGVVKVADLETGQEDLIHIVYLRPYNERKSPPPKDDEFSDNEQGEVEIQSEGNEPSQTPNNDTPRNITLRRDKDLEEIIQDNDHEVSDVEQDLESEADSRDDNFQTPEDSFNWEELSPGVSPNQSILKKYESSPKVTPTPTITSRLRDTFGFKQPSPVHEPEGASGSSQLDEPSTPRRSPHNFGQRLLDKIKISPNKRQSTGSGDPKSSTPGEDGGDLNDSMDLRRSKRLATKPVPQYKETRIETAREKTARKKKNDCCDIMHASVITKA